MTTEEDRILIENLYLLKGYGAKRLIEEFPTTSWKQRTLNYFVDEAIEQWRKRLKACVKANGQHFEQMLQLCNFFCGDASTVYFEHCVNFRYFFLCEIFLTTLCTSQSESCLLF